MHVFAVHSSDSPPRLLKSAPAVITRRQSPRSAWASLCFLLCTLVPSLLPAQDVFEFFFRETPADRRRLEAIEISPQEEADFGDKIFQQFAATLRQQGIRLSNRSRDAKYLQQLTQMLHQQMRHAERYRSITVWIADSDATDARTFPGGHIVVFRGLIELAESEAAIIGVLGHELSHLDREHLLEFPRRLKLTEQTLSSGQLQFDQWMQSSRLFANFFARPFRPEQESEADQDAVRWAIACDYDALEFAHLFQRLQQREPQIAESLPSFLRSHPLTADRVRAIRQQNERAGPVKAAAYRGRENLKRRIPRERQRFAE